MRDHLFIASDGDMFDTRSPDWSKHPLRRDYRRTFGTISTVAQFKATLRNGGYAWPGGYPMYFVTSDGGALCFKCARNEARSIMCDVADGMGGWNLAGCQVNWEDSELYCDHCNEKIESAYGED